MSSNPLKRFRLAAANKVRAHGRVGSHALSHLCGTPAPRSLALALIVRCRAVRDRWLVCLLAVLCWRGATLTLSQRKPCVPYDMSALFFLAHLITGSESVARPGSYNNMLCLM